MADRDKTRVQGGKKSVFLTRPFIHHGIEQKYVPLSQGYVSLLDAEDFERFGHLKWSAQVTRTGYVYAYRNVKTEDRRQKNVYLHRLILDAPLGCDVDHANHNTLDNRRSNIRLASRSQNSFNRKYPKGNNQTGFRGVGRRASGNYFGVVQANRISHRTPTVTSPEQAARDRDALALRLHGEFAVCNFTPDQPAA